MTIDSTAAGLAAHGVAYAGEIAAAARRHGLDPALLAAVAAQETGGPETNAGRNVVGDGGHGRGLFQIDDRWHAFAKTAAAMDPARNAEYAAGMLRGLVDCYHGDVREALSAYNSGDPHGAGTPTVWPDGRRLSYADSVMRHYGDLGGTAAAAEALEPDLPAAIASLQALPSMAGTLPAMSPPQMPTPPQTYHRQMTDYSDLLDQS